MDIILKNVVVNSRYDKDMTIKTLITSISRLMNGGVVSTEEIIVDRTSGGD